MSDRQPRALRASRSGVIALVGATLALTAATVAAHGAAADRGQALADHTLPPGAVRLPNGRFVRPAGHSYDLGDFALGLAVAPSGRCVAATDEGWGAGQPIPAVPGVNDAGAQPDEGVTAVDLATGHTTFVTAATAGSPQHNVGNALAYRADGTKLYVSGGASDAVYEFHVADDCSLTFVQSVALPSQAPPASTSSFTGATAAHSRGLAVASDGTVLATTEYGRALSVVPVDANGGLTQAQIAVAFGTPTVVPHSTNILNFVDGVANDTAPSYLYAVAAATNPATGRVRAYITAEGTKQLLVADVDAAGHWAAGPVAPVGDHPTGVAVSADERTVIVANANSDSASVVPVNADGSLGSVASVTLHAAPGEATGSAPDAVAFDGNDRAYVALAGDDAVAVLDRGGAGWTVSGFVPTGWYPSAVAVRPGDHTVLAVAAKGLGSRYTANNPSSPIPVPYEVAQGGSPSLLPNSVSTAGPHPEVRLPSLNYNDKANMPSLLSRFTLDHGVDGLRRENLGADSALVARAIRQAGDVVERSEHNPVPDASNAGDSPIEHVVYIVRENRTYDQVFGDLGRTRPDVNADPSYEYLASATPQAHAIVGRFASSDNFFSDGEASVQGHWWTSSANSTDWIEKAWRLNYSDRNRGADFLSPVASPQNCSIFQSALAKQTAGGGFTLRNYGEFFGAVTPDGNGLPVDSPCSPFLGPNFLSYNGLLYTDTTAFPCPQAGAACGQLTGLLRVGSFPIYSYTDLSYPSAINGDAGLSVDDRLGAAEFLRDIGVNADGTAAAAGAGDGFGLASFSYLVLPEDHTTGLSATFTPRAEVAQNDAALGQILAALSRSSYWSSTAVFVEEDDSQDGADHVDGHRNVLLVASPYVKQTSADGQRGGYVGRQRYDQSSVMRTMELILGLPALSSYDQNARPLYDLFQDKTAADLTAADLAPYVPAAAPGFIDERVASLPSTPALEQLRTQSLALPVGQDIQGPMLELIDWQVTTDRPPPPALLEEVRRAGASGTANDDD